MDNLNYDQALQRAETIIRELENTEAISVEEYRTKAKEVTTLLDYCQQQVRKMGDELENG